MDFGLLRCVASATIWFFAIAPVALAADKTGNEPFAIEMVDAETGRGVPLVELETIDHVRFVTDSSGLVAIADADLLGKTVHFTIRSHGYEFPKDGFGFHGKAIKLEPGGKATLKIKRINLAERLYRATGGGIYRDTLLLGRQPPIEKPLVAAGVVGCDSVMTAEYQGKCFWFWGDTSRPEYPLAANFHITGATSRLPGQGGLDPLLGVNFEYFVGPDQRVRAMAEMPGDGPTWIGSVTVLSDAAGKEKLVANYVKIRNQLESYEWGFVVWNDKAERFEKLTSFDKKPSMFLEPQVHTFLKRDDGIEYVYFANPLPLTRVKAELDAFIDPSRYEGFTCLQPGTLPADKKLDRNEDGKLRYGWKANTPHLDQQDQAKLVQTGAIKADEQWIALRDVESGREFTAHRGTVYWNEYRQRWILITVEIKGESSMLGEVWFAEADEPTGPWVYARKVVTHEKYSFYNPKHHPFFDQDGGQTIFFEGTYTHTFSGNPIATPRYDYNQVMYQLDLSLSALNLPVAFYGDADAKSLASGTESKRSTVAFFALERAKPETIPIARKENTLQPLTKTDKDQPLFHALPGDMEKPPATTTPLYEFVHRDSGQRAYATNPDWSQPGYDRSDKPVCRVWKNPRQR